MATERRRLRGSGEILLRHPADGWSGTGWRVGHSRVRPSLFGHLAADGWTFAQIVASYPDFTPAEILAALAFCQRRSAAARRGWGRRKRNVAEPCVEGQERP